MTQPTCCIDGFGPLSVVRPTTVADLGEIIARASADGAALYPIGGQTQIGLGHPPIKAGTVVDMRGLDQVIDFPARDMTITVQAGITIARLQALLSPENLRLPIDVPQAEQATLGGSIAANVSGPRRYGFGTLRDYVIGISALNDVGREFKAGGRVVKNVAGYDLCKLLVGSLGTIGIITQVTLKLRPLPEEHALISLGCAADALDGMLDRLHATRTRPVSIELLNRLAAGAVFQQAGLVAPDAAWTLIAGYEGNADAVHWQVQQLIKEVGDANQLEAQVGYTARPLWDALVDGSGRGDAAVSFKANLLPSAVGAFCRSADRDPDRPVLQAHAGNGIVHGRWGDTLAQPRAIALRAAWRAEAARGKGGVVVERCPSGWKQALPVWDPLANGWLMRAVKERFDPRRIFNPGRFVEGI